MWHLARAKLPTLGHTGDKSVQVEAGRSTFMSDMLHQLDGQDSQLSKLK